MRHAELKPTPDQSVRLEGSGPYDFVRLLARTREAQESGRVEEACNERFRAVQRLEELLPDDEETLFDWGHANTRAALEVVYLSAVDHFLVDDFELSAALGELLLDLDPEDHLGVVGLLAFDYVALEDFDSFDEVIDGLSEKSVERALALLWAGFRRRGAVPREESERFRERFAPYWREFTAADHPADGAYLRDIESERPSQAAQARELWLRTENLWRRFPGFVEALE